MRTSREGDLTSVYRPENTSGFWVAPERVAIGSSHAQVRLALWAAKFKKYAVQAGVNEPKKNCHEVRKARAEVAAYADCTERQMMAMFGWTDPKMPAHYIAQANREKLGMSAMDKVVAFDQSQSLDDFMPVAEENSGGTRQANKVVTLRSNFGKKIP